MKRVLYLTNYEVPYRVRFFNELAQFCELTVLYESQSSEERNKTWAHSETRRHRVKYLKGNVSGIFGMLREIFSGYDVIIVGCFNSPVQMLAILAMRLLRKPYFVNLDGETFLSGNSLKAKLKRFFLSGAAKYLVAGEKAGEALKPIAAGAEIVPYYFSSLSENEVQENGNLAAGQKRGDTILVVAQYLHVKGNDVALDCARLDPSLHYKFVGMGSRTEQFLADFRGRIPANVEIVPFLQKQELEREYRNCAMLVLPSRQECWGLVVNEAASFGTPIVSTWGSGAAVEFLADKYPQYLAQPGDPEDLSRCIQAFLESKNKAAYSQYLLGKSQKYNIEKSVQAHLESMIS